MSKQQTTDNTQRSHIHANGQRLSYLEWGEQGPALVLLHGLTNSASTWWQVAQRLHENGYHVYAFDMPGHGESAETVDHHIESIAATIAAAMRVLRLDDITLIGHSWGATTALVLAHSADGALLRRVVLIEPPLRSRGPERMPMFLAGVGDPPESNMPRLRMFNPDWHEHDLQMMSEALQSCRPEAVRGLYLQSGTWDYTPYLSEIAVPLLLLLGNSANSAVSAEERANLPHLPRPTTSLHELPNTTHYMFRGAGYEPTMTALLAWLA